LVGDSIAYWPYRSWASRPANGPEPFRLVSFCRRGARIRDIKVHTEQAWREWGQLPDLCIVHAGTNDLGQLPCKEVREELAGLWTFLGCLPGRTQFLFSDITPRPQGNHPADWDPRSVKKMDERRTDTNRFGRRLAYRSGGGFIRHPDIRLDSAELFRADGLHLSAAGGEQFMRDIVKVIGFWLR
jgi:lysophospholipase L1-like esterase